MESKVMRVAFPKSGDTIPFFVFHGFYPGLLDLSNLPIDFSRRYRGPFYQFFMFDKVL